MPKIITRAKAEKRACLKMRCWYCTKGSPLRPQFCWRETPNGGTPRAQAGTDVRACRCVRENALYTFLWQPQLQESAKGRERTRKKAKEQFDHLNIAYVCFLLWGKKITEESFLWAPFPSLCYFLLWGYSKKRQNFEQCNFLHPQRVNLFVKNVKRGYTHLAGKSSYTCAFAHIHICAARFFYFPDPLGGA